MAGKGMSLQICSSSLARFSNILVTIVIFLLAIVETEDLKLKLVQLLIRHGDRSPIGTFATDRWKNAWPDGLGQLTQLGMQQQFDTGRYMRNRYENLMNDTHDYDNVYVRSTNVDRNLMSASYNLAGFFPPKGTLIMKKRICWEPIPIHTVPIKYDYLISFFAECPAFDIFKKLLRSSKTKEILYKYWDLVTFIGKNTKNPKINMQQMFEFADAMLVHSIHNLTLPDWVNERTKDGLKMLTRDYFTLLSSLPEIMRIRGGPFIGEITKTMQKVVDNRSDRHKISIFMSHDVSIISILSALGLYEPHLPPYCSAVMFELLEKKRNYYVKILYRNDTMQNPYELSLNGCSSPCPFEKFKKLTSPVVPVDIKSECFT